MVNVKIKWNKEKYEGVEVDASDDGALELLQAQIFSLTKVPVERQKILLKGKILKADGDLAKVKEGATILVMGTAEVMKEPTPQVVFEEDLTDDQKYQINKDPGGGLHNLGNTCYMNSGLQMLRQIPELNDALTTFKTYAKPPEIKNEAERPAALEHALVANMGELFEDQANQAQPITPAVFTQVFRTMYPRFAERDEKTGGFKQQDAHESLNELLTSMARKLTNVPSYVKEDKVSNWIDYLFQGEMQQVTKCVDSDADAPRVETQPFRQLSCNITIDVNYMYEGIKLSLNETLEMRSPSLGVMANHSRVTKISKLPRYLVVQFVRFFWKRDTNTQSKILRKVKYPAKFDIMEMCTDEMKKKLLNARNILSDDQEKALGIKPVKGHLAKKQKEQSEGEKKDSEADMDESADLVDEIDTSGNYSLQAIVTHKGRSSNGGHYVGWTKKDDKEWTKYDDDVVTVLPSDKAMDLMGGGDWHMAYIVLYKREDDMKERREKLSQVKS